VDTSRVNPIDYDFDSPLTGFLNVFVGRHAAPAIIGVSPLRYRLLGQCEVDSKGTHSGVRDET